MNLFFDFDSTIIQTESLDELAKMILKNDPKRIKEFEEITTRGMIGDMDFNQSLSNRLELISATKLDINNLIVELKNSLSPSVDYLKKILENKSTNCFVISGGFIDYILPICIELGFKESNIFANKFNYENERVIGFESTNLLSKSKGKSMLIQSLNLSKPIVMIGDGYTDLEVKLESVADKFIAFTENISRPIVVENADLICQNFNQVQDFIYG